jgi:hypothetical protein
LVCSSVLSFGDKGYLYQGVGTRFPRCHGCAALLVMPSFRKVVGRPISRMKSARALHRLLPASPGACHPGGELLSKRWKIAGHCLWHIAQSLFTVWSVLAFDSYGKVKCKRCSK